MSIPPTLLLADDSLTIQRVVSLTFADQPIRVVVAKDGQDAINRMTTERPDLVLADTNMPCVDGYELARWVRQQPHLSAVPVLLLAGVTDPVDEQRLHDSGANGVLEKPFEPSHVISRVKELLGLKGTPPAATSRLVTSPEMTPARTVAPPRPAGAGSAERPETSAAPVDAPPAVPVSKSGGRGIFGAIATVSDAPIAGRAEPPPVDQTPPVEGADEEHGAPDDARAWFADHEPAAMSEASAALAEELGVSGRRLDATADDVRAPERGDRGLSSSSPADVFESLLAAEQGNSPAVVIRSAAPELTPEILDQLAARVVEHLHSGAFGDDLQRGLALGLRETMIHTVRESVAAETRAALAEAIQASISGSLVSALRGAVNEAIAAALPAAVEHQVGPQVENVVRATVEPVVQERLGAPLLDVVRETVDHAVRDALAATVPAAVHETLQGDSGDQVREIVRETAERLVSEEIARIRERRG